MTTTRRILVLAGMILAVMIGTSIPASATFADSVALPTTSISTSTVAAPVSGPGSLTCGSSTATMGLTWTTSTSARVTGYLVTVHFSDGFTQTVQKTAADTSWSQSINLYYVTAYSIRYTVTTQTDYGWTAESIPTAWFQC